LLYFVECKIVDKMKCSQLAQQKQDNIEMTETVDAALAQVRQLQQEQIAKEKKLDKLKNVESTFDNTFNQVCVCVCVCRVRVRVP
jgi:hypothetical protein